MRKSININKFREQLNEIETEDELKNLLKCFEDYFKDWHESCGDEFSKAMADQMNIMIKLFSIKKGG